MHAMTTKKSANYQTMMTTITYPAQRAKHFQRKTSGWLTDENSDSSTRSRFTKVQKNKIHFKPNFPPKKPFYLNSVECPFADDDKIFTHMM